MDSKRCKVLNTLLAALCLTAQGCNREPVSPATKVLNNPPTEIDSHVITNCRVLLNQQELGTDPIRLRTGQQFTAVIEMTISRDSEIKLYEIQPWIRMLPENSSDSDWKSFKNNRQYGIFGRGKPDNIVFSTDHNLREPPGVYDVRVYVFHAPLVGDEYGYWLVKTGKSIIEPSDEK